MRPSEDTRERTLAHLRRGYVSGRMGTETFALRIDRALHAPSHAELRGLTADLPVPARPSLRERLRALAERRGAAPLRLPPAAELTYARLTLGRGPDCSVVLADDTVSRRHAELVLCDGVWLLRDLGSANGSWVNGRRVVEAEVLPGDEIVLGGCRFIL